MLVRLLTALGAGADDARGWAESEVREGFPQLARYRLLRALAQDVQAWDAVTVAALRYGTSQAEDVIDIARAVARETTFSVLYRLSDPDSDDLPVDLQRQLPGWALVETTPVGELTGRVLGAVYEDLNTLDPGAEAARDTTVAAGWIWETNLRPFCESLAAEVAYDFDDSDWLAIDTALPGTDDEQPLSAWYVYPLVGRRRVELHVAQSVGGGEVSVSVQGAVDGPTRSRVALLLDVMARYRMIASE